MTLNIELSDEQAARLEASAQAAGLSLSEFVRRLIERPGKDEPVRRAADIVLDCMADVPDDVMQQLPKDGASEHDHYIYGLPKKGR